MNPARDSFFSTDLMRHTRVERVPLAFFPFCYTFLNVLEGELAANYTYAAMKEARLERAKLLRAHRPKRCGFDHFPTLSMEMV